MTNQFGNKSYFWQAILPSGRTVHSVEQNWWPGCCLNSYRANAEAPVTQRVWQRGYLREPLSFLLRSCNNLAGNPITLCKNTSTLPTLCKGLNSSGFLPSSFVFSTGGTIMNRVNYWKKWHHGACLTILQICTAASVPEEQEPSEVTHATC